MLIKQKQWRVNPGEALRLFLASPQPFFYLAIVPFILKAAGGHHPGSSIVNRAFIAERLAVQLQQVRVLAALWALRVVQIPEAARALLSLRFGAVFQRVTQSLRPGALLQNDAAAAHSFRGKQRREGSRFILGSAQHPFFSGYSLSVNTNQDTNRLNLFVLRLSQSSPTGKKKEKKKATTSSVAKGGQAEPRCGNAYLHGKKGGTEGVRWKKKRKLPNITTARYVRCAMSKCHAPSKLRSSDRRVTDTFPFLRMYTRVRG